MTTSSYRQGLVVLSFPIDFLNDARHEISNSPTLMFDAVWSGLIIPSMLSSLFPQPLRMLRPFLQHRQHWRCLVFIHDLCFCSRWHKTGCDDFIAKDEWPPNSESTRLLHAAFLAKACHKLKKRHYRRFEAHCTTTNDLPQKPLTGDAHFRKRLQACKDWGCIDHFKCFTW